MNKILNIYKPAGLTPLQVIQKLREIHPELRDVKIGYAGRLDPMARGVLLLMAGDATKERDKYLNLDKEYVFELLFGFETDTYDLLGMVIKKSDKKLNAEDAVNNLVEICNSYPKKFMQKYPPYSSKTVNGKPLFEYSREGRIDEIEVPEKQVKIYKLDILGFGKISPRDLEIMINEKIKAVSGDFRQEKILEKWKNELSKKGNEEMAIMKLRVNCSSGTYVRSLVHEMGTRFGTGAVALDIFRTKAGSFDINDSIKLFS